MHLVFFRIQSFQFAELIHISLHFSGSAGGGAPAPKHQLPGNGNMLGDPESGGWSVLH
jgi:hypothetical protein